MNPEAHISGETLTLLWRAQREAGVTKYLVGVERCGDEEIDQGKEENCKEVLSAQVEQDARTVMTMEETSAELAPCVDYHVILRAMAPTGMVSKETALVTKPESDCDAKSLQDGLVITICVLGILVLLCVIVLVYYLKRRPMGRLQRVRSKVYSRLYSRDRYEKPIPKAEFIKRAGDLLRRHEEVEEEEGDGRGSQDGLHWERRRPRSISSTSASAPTCPLRAEFEELDRLSSATIRRRSEAAALAVNRLRNRYHDIVPYDANRVRLQRPLALEEGAKGVRGEVSDYVNASSVGPDVDAAAAASVTLPERANVAVFRRPSAVAQDASHNVRYFLRPMMTLPTVNTLAIMAISTV